MAVRTEKNKDVWTIIHSRAEARNAVDTEHSFALYEAFQAFENGPAKVAVFWGEGGHFCAGWDLKLVATLKDSPDEAALFDGLDISVPTKALGRGPMGPSRMTLTKPVIAAVEGAAVAGGMELAIWCDIRVMAETAYMGVYCRRWGITLVDGGTLRLPRLVGQGRALEIALTGRRVDADECLQIGLCEKIAPEGQARAAAEAMAQEIARFPQEAMLADRRAMIENHGKSVEDALRFEWTNGKAAIRNQGTSGAGRFSAGAGRHGDFGEI
jgi:enoyl-CoA hydratase